MSAYTAEKKLNSDSCGFSFPVIDLEPLTKDAAARKEIIGRVKDACEAWGAFQIVNHGIPISVMDKIIDGVKRFHELDIETKKQYHSPGFDKNVVFNSNKTTGANCRDSLHLKLAPKPPRPEELPQVCRDIMLESTERIKKLGTILFELLSEALGLNPNHLKDMECTEKLYALCHYYRACPGPDLTLGLHGHTDCAILTILLEDQTGGLQFHHENQWVDVPPSPGTLTVIMGEIMEFITNAKFESAFHRVAVKDVGPRVSVTFQYMLHYHEFNKPKLYGPIKELLSEENPPVFREATIEEIVACQAKKGGTRMPLRAFAIEKAP